MTTPTSPNAISLYDIRSEYTTPPTAGSNVSMGSERSTIYGEPDFTGGTLPSSDSNIEMSDFYGITYSPIE